MYSASHYQVFQLASTGRVIPDIIYSSGWYNCTYLRGWCQGRLYWAWSSILRQLWRNFHRI